MSVHLANTPMNRKNTSPNYKIGRYISDSWLLRGGLRFEGGFFLHFPPQTFYRIKQKTPPGDNNSFWHPRTTSTPAVSADQTPTCLQCTSTTTTLALHLQLRLCLANLPFIIYCKRGNIWDVKMLKCLTERGGGDLSMNQGWQGRSRWGLWRSKRVFLARMIQCMYACMPVCMCASVCVHKERGRCQQGKP